MTIEDAKTVISKQLKISPDEVKPESRLLEDLKADSLDIVELVMELEEQYGMEIPDEEMPGLVTVQDVVTYVEEHK